jgi:flavocytochrome c
MSLSSTWAIVIGGGLSGLSAAHTILQAGGKVVLIDKCAFMGGNSTKATSGINGSETRTQKAMGIEDSNAIFEEDTIRGATGVKKGPCPPKYPLGTTITHQSGDAVHWLIDKFDLVLDTVSRLGGHSQPRTHRRKSGGKFPGFMITYALMQKFDEICASSPDKARFINKARVNKLLQDSNGTVIGCEYLKNGQTFTEMGPVCICTGGYAAGNLEKGSIMDRVRPDLMSNPTTNGTHCTGDGITMAEAIGAKIVDIKAVQVHPTGLINPSMPDSKVLFLAAEALRGEGGVLIDKNGKRFCNSLGTRDYVSKRMFDHNQFPYRLVLNSQAVKGIAWHCHHYCGRGVMKVFETGQDLAKEMGIDSATLQETFDDYNKCAADPSKDPWETKYFPAGHLDVNDKFNVAIVRPVNHYTMGGVGIDTESRVLAEAGGVIPGLFSGGEATGGVHGNNRLGGSGLLECVVFGRLAGASCAKYIESLPAPASSGAAVTISIPQSNGTTITVTITGEGVSGVPAASSAAPAPSAPAEEPAQPAEAPPQKEYTLEEVAKHNTEEDCWVVVNGQVLDVTKFLPDHPGGAMAIVTFAGKDASEMFDMVHEEGVIEKFAPECVIGTLKASSKM